ncbi:hypothetical protein [Caballeronia sp. LZ019]|uniref:hypothetical protein n=1 Tax=Caballeronia sp. LZ019 TaxID=3038555 RepID=UPI00285FDFCE|nr:hypothetical protein [Caballeronia sp. LZ019]MDR5808433.1 hypothetical protein [Caballeronia sp. LZ019]
MVARTSNTTIPIIQVKPNLKDAVRMAVAEIRRFLEMCYPAQAITQTEADKAIAGLWLSRIKGFHDDDDFLHLTRDFIAYLLSGGARSQISDQLGYYFSGFMPSYGASCIFVQTVAEGGTWDDVRAFMHSQAYGNAREYVESFDWDSGRKKADEEVKAWAAIVRQQDSAWKPQAAARSCMRRRSPCRTLPSRIFRRTIRFFPSHRHSWRWLEAEAQRLKRRQVADSRRWRLK